MTQPFYVLVSGEAIVLHLVETQWDFWPDLSVEYFKMIVKCILQRLGARARDSDICQCWMPQTQSPTSMCWWRFAVVDLPELDLRYQITANSENEVIVTSLWKPIPNSNVQAQLIWCGWIGADTVLKFNMPRFDRRIKQVGNLWLDLIKIALAGLCLARCLLWRQPILACLLTCVTANLLDGGLNPFRMCQYP